MELFGSYESLDERDKRVFTEAIQALQHHSYVLRGGMIRSNPIYSFIEKHEDLVSTYLEIGGWKLHLDREQGVARLYHPEGTGRVRFNKEETILILTLRLLYHEHKQKVSERPDVIITVGAIREKLHALVPQGIVKPFLNRKNMGVHLRKLERFQLIGFEGSPYTIEDDTVIVLRSTLEHAVSSQAIEESKTRLLALTAARANPVSTESDLTNDEESL